MKLSVIIGTVLFILGQILIWYQTNGQFFSTWAKKNSLIMACIGIPISYLFIHATRLIVNGFDGAVWPSRLIGFSTGMLVFGTLTWLHLNQTPTLKTWVTLLLAAIIVGIQILWK